MSTPVGVIKKFVDTLTKTKQQGEAAADEAFKAVGAVSYDVFREKYNSAAYGVNYQNFAEQECGVRITNADTGAITGSDAGGNITKTVESIVPETSKAVNLTNAQYKSFTKSGLKFNVTYLEKSDVNAGEAFNYSGATYLEKQKLVTRALYNWWIPESIDLINESLDINFTDDSSNLKEINIEFDSWNTMNINTTMELYFEYDLGRASKVTIILNANLLNNLTKNDKNGTLDKNQNYRRTAYPYVTTGYGSTYSFTNYLDRLFLMAFTEIALKSNIAYLEDLPKDVFEGLCAIVGGYDDASSYYGEFVNRDNSNSVTGYTRLRYLAKNYSDGLPDGVTYNSKKTSLTVTTDYDEKTLDLADFESSVKNVNAKALKKNIKITGNALNNSIVGGSGNDYLLGGKGNDTLNGGKGDDTLKGGAGDDVFIYTAGNDVISDYAAGDKISLGASIKNATLSGSDVVFTIGKNTLTVKDARDKTLTLINSKGKESTTIVSGDTNLTLTDSDKAAVTLESGIKTADASARTKKIKIVGNTSDNSIVGGKGNDSLWGGAGKDTLIGGDGKDILYGGKDNDELRGNTGNDKLYGEAGDDILKGGKGNDSLWGGAGNDTLIGGDGKDVFVYKADEGTDTIFDYQSGDLLTILKSNGKDGGTFSKASFGGDSLTLTISGGGKIIFEDVSSGDKININGKSYTIKGSTLK